MSPHILAVFLTDLFLNTCESTIDSIGRPQPAFGVEKNVRTIIDVPHNDSFGSISEIDNPLLFLTLRFIFGDRPTDELIWGSSSTQASTEGSVPWERDSQGSLAGNPYTIS